jgi:hypothetical protein
VTWTLNKLTVRRPCDIKALKSLPLSDCSVFGDERSIILVEDAIHYIWDLDGSVQNNFEKLKEGLVARYLSFPLSREGQEIS